MNDYILNINYICNREEELDIYQERIHNIPIWRCVYRKYRDRYIEDKCGVPPMKNHSVLSIMKMIHSTLRGFRDFIKYTLLAQSIDNIVYGFPRLESVDGIYIDKFCDFLIKNTDISQSYLYMERGRSGRHFTERPLRNIFWLEFIDNIALLGSRILGPIIYRTHKSTFDRLFFKASKLCRFDKKDKKFVINRFANDIIRYRLSKILLKRIKAKRIFATTLHANAYLIATAKVLNIPCYEIQHGITEGPTPMYSGTYIEDFSPTAFLAFGQTSMIPVFNVPINKMINIGFAYKDYLKSKNINIHSDTYLIVSDPEITSQIIDVACELKKTYSFLEFHIRFHPLEKPTKQHINRLLQSRIKVATNETNSTLASMAYAGIIGEKSSVLYECVSMGKKTGKLFFGGMNVGINPEEEEKKGFYILTTIEGFTSFHEKRIDMKNIPEYYSEFERNAVNALLD